MKKILLSMIMLCTAMSAWSYETETVTISCNGTNTSPFTVDATTASDGRDAAPYWQVDDYNTLVLKAPTSYYVTKVEFTTMSGKVGICDKLKWYQLNVWVSQNSDDLQYYDVITFSNPEGSIAKVTSMTVTYHRCSGTHQEAVPGTCTTKGRAEYWKCECGKIYSDNACNNEVTDMASLETDIDPNKHINTTHEDGIPATCCSLGYRENWKCNDCGVHFEGPDCKVVVDIASPIDPKNHESELTEHKAKDATCVSDGNIHYWHCDACEKDFEDEGGKGEAIPDVTISKEQGSHNNLSFVPQKDATCLESGYAMDHYHCSVCGKNFKEEACTTQITEVVVIPAINHKNKKSTEAVAPTTETTGNVAYWYCPDCDKHFGDEGCTKELTEWILEKLMNMMHLDFAGTSVPIEAEHYLNTAKFNFTDGGDIILTVNDESVTYDKEMINKVKFSNGTPGVKISANEDPDNKGTYYSTFYSSLESYAVPEGFTAYRGEISSDGTKLTLISIGDGVMTRGEGYILKGTASSGNMNVTANAGSSSDNKLQGTDVAIASLGANDYALSHGSNGVGFYLWSGKNIGANKAYLELPASSVKAFTFEFEEATGIHNSQFIIHNSENAAMYNLNGVRVDENYKGIVIKNGKKVYQR
ncbi:MAG: hypothetical protein Q4A08_01865 [Bacteroidales bacterium]|nr:hypothetical protein [Bacteroidales bacterium]